MSQIRYTQAGGHTINMTAPLSSASIHKTGDFLIWDSTNGGQIAASAGGPAVAISGNDNRLLGRANEDALDANGVVKPTVSVSMAQPLARWMMWIRHATAASAVATPLSQLGVAYELWYESAVKGWGVDISETTDLFLIIVDYVTGNLSTDALPTWPKATTAGTNLSPPVWVSPILASCACVR